MQVHVERVSIVDVETEAIVNAANKSLLGGGGVDGVIHRAAGPGLLEECRKLGGCNVGQVKATGAHNLPYSHILHTVGPIWRGGEQGERDLLAACYRNTIALATLLSIKSIAFPAISTGAYAFPQDQAARIAVDTVLSAPKSLDQIVLVAIDAGTERLLNRTLKAARDV